MFEYVDWASPCKDSNIWAIVGLPKGTDSFFGLWLMPADALSLSDCDFVAALPTGRVTGLSVSQIGVLIIVMSASETRDVRLVHFVDGFPSGEVTKVSTNGMFGDLIDVTAKGLYAYMEKKGRIWIIHHRSLLDPGIHRSVEYRGDSHSVVRAFLAPCGELTVLRETDRTGRSCVYIVDVKGNFVATGISQALQIRWVSSRYFYAIGSFSGSELSLLKWDSISGTCVILQKMTANYKFLSVDSKLTWIRSISDQEFIVGGQDGDLEVVRGSAPASLGGHSISASTVLFISDSETARTISAISVMPSITKEVTRRVVLVRGESLDPVDRKVPKPKQFPCALTQADREVLEYGHGRPLFVFVPDPGPWAPLNDFFHQGIRRACREVFAELIYVSVPQRAYIANQQDCLALSDYVERCRRLLPENIDGFDLLFEGYSGAAKLATTAALQLGGSVFLRAPVPGVAGMVDGWSNRTGRRSESCQEGVPIPVEGENRKLIVVHGDRDSRVPVASSIELVQTWRRLNLGTSELRLIPNVGHSLESADRKAIEAVAFFRELLEALKSREKY